MGGAWQASSTKWRRMSVPRGVCGDLGVELHRIQTALAILHGRDGCRGRRRGAGEPVRRPHDAVAVAHPGGLLGRQVAEEQAVGAEHDGRLAELADAGVGDIAAQRGRHRLHAVTDAEHRHAQLEQPRVDRRRTGLVDRCRPAREDDPDRVVRGHLDRRHVVGHDLGVDPALAHPPRDQLGVLRPEVDHQHGPVLGARLLDGRRLAACPRRLGQRLIPIACSRCSFLPSVWSAGANMISAF